MKIEELKPNIIVRGPIFPEPVLVIVSTPIGQSIKLVGKGLKSGQVYEPILSADQLSLLEATPEKEPFDGDPRRFRLGIEALRLALAYEYDPYFSLSIARVDPLPHQLEGVYDYFMLMPRIRFLLADDPGAGKTIMAGLLLKELKIRGLVKRTLIVSPANLCFQWQREMRDKFHENFDIMRGEVLRSTYGTNPWQEKNQVVTSISWVSRIEDAHESLLRSQWDLIVVDEAHKMSAYSAEKKTLAYQLGEALSAMTDHYLLMTATPHKGDPKNFCLFLELLDKDVYGDVKSLEEAMRRNVAPFYLRRTKEALVTFPDAETGEIKKIFTKREVQTVEFKIDLDEWDFYDALTRYVEDQSIKASADDSARGRALTFIMAMLQRRFASSIYAVRRSLERMRDKRQKILDDPEAYRRGQIEKKIPEDFDELPEDEQQAIIDALEEVVASVDPVALREEILRLDGLIAQAKNLEQREVESKLVKLKEVITDRGVFDDPKMKLLIFTEHKDTLDYLVGKLEEWHLTYTKIHGSMKIGDRNNPGTRLYAEKEFRDDVQVLVATEAAGEGINLQFCWFMINYDIPWNPVRLEQRMGRIHRYGQEHDCLILNFAAVNTREGRVLQKLLDRLKEIRKELGTDQVFDVVGEVFPSNLLERLFRDMYAKRTDLPDIEARIVKDIDADRFRAITESALEGLAKRELNLSALVGKSAEARERRLVPEVIEDFFMQASPLAGINPRETKRDSHVYRVGRIPRYLWPVGERLEPRFGKLGREYRQIVFDKTLLVDDPTSEWVTPGHPLFEVVREEVVDRVRDDLQRGSVFFDLHRNEPYRLDVFTASVKDGKGNHLHRKLFVVEVKMDGSMWIRQPTIFLDLALAPSGIEPPQGDGLPTRQAAEQTLIEKALNPFLVEVAAGRAHEINTISQHIEISLNELIHRQNLRMADLLEQQQKGVKSPLLAANIKQVEDRIDELNGRLERRREELQMERQCMIGDIVFTGSAWVLPHPERSSEDISSVVRDDEIERIAVNAVISHEESRGWKVESVEEENRGFDLISRRYTHIELPSKGRSSYYVYAIECSGDSVYIGQTDNLQDRWEEHISGKGAEWTKHHRPLRLPYYEEYSSREEAVQREKQLKSGSGREWLKETIARALPVGKQTSPGPACRQAGDPSTATEIRFIEVKGRSGVGEVALSTNEYKTAERLKKDYWLYVVFNCASSPEINLIRDPARLGWEPLVKIEHYHLGANQILDLARKQDK